MNPPALSLINYLMAQSSTVLDAIADTETPWGRLILRDGIPFKLATTGKRALVISSGPGTNYTTHAVGALCSVRIYADHTRDSSKIAVVEDGLDRAWDVYPSLDQLLHAAKDLSTDPLVQSTRASMPLESFDNDQDLPYLVVNYDVAILSG